MFISTAAADAAGIHALDTSLYVKAAPGVSQATTRAAVESVTASYPTAKVMDLTQYKAEQGGNEQQWIELAPAAGRVVAPNHHHQQHRIQRDPGAQANQVEQFAHV